jgi:hypothetical protein
VCVTCAAQHGDEWLSEELDGAFSGLTARQSDQYGWDRIVHPALSRDLLSLHDGNTTLRLALPRFEDYDIRAKETVVFTVT